MNVPTRPGGVVLAASALLAFLPAVQGDWPTLRGNVQHTGFVPAELKEMLRALMGNASCSALPLPKTC